MNKHDYKIEIGANTDCYNEPYKIYITLQSDIIEIEAIKMKYDINCWTYEDSCKIDFVNDTIKIQKGFKDRLTLSEKIDSMIKIGTKFLTITNFEYNVSKKLLEKN